MQRNRVFVELAQSDPTGLSTSAAVLRSITRTTDLAGIGATGGSVGCNLTLIQLPNFSRTRSSRRDIGGPPTTIRAVLLGKIVSLMESLEICDAQSIDRFRSSPFGSCTGGLSKDQFSQVKSGDLMRFRHAEL